MKEVVVEAAALLRAGLQASSGNAFKKTIDLGKRRKTISLLSLFSHTHSAAPSTSTPLGSPSSS